MSNRVFKKLRANPSFSTIGPGGETFDQNVSVLAVESNECLRTISDCPRLTTMKLVNTCIERIERCPIVYSLAINNNTSLKTLIMSSVREVSIAAAMDLQTLTLDHATKIHLNDLQKLSMITAPRLTDIMMTDMKFCGFHCFPKMMNTVELIRLNDFQSLNGLDGTHICRLRLDGCDIRTVSYLNTIDELIVENCLELLSIEYVSKMKKLTVRNCPKLISVDVLEDVVHLSIDRCDALSRISNVKLDTLEIHYCFSLRDIASLESTSISVSHCPELIILSIEQQTTYAEIKHCNLFESIEFCCSSPDCYTDLEIVISDLRKLRRIKDWYAAHLRVINCAQLKSIANVYNLTRLVVEDCPSITNISNVFVGDTLQIHRCPELASISNVYGLEHLSLVECESLCDFNVLFETLLSLTVDSCPELRIVVNGKTLQTLTLINSGLTYVYDISIQAWINVKNVSFLPDLHSDLDNGMSPAIGDEACTAVIELARCMTRIMQLAGVVERWYLARLIRFRYKNYLRLKEQNALYDCTICCDAICSATLRLIECAHIFHDQCLNTWLSYYRRCPLCNHPI